MTPHRLLLIVPSALAATANAWFHDAINPEGGDWLTIPLYAEGAGPQARPTHFICDVALDDEQAKLVARFMLQLTDDTQDLPANYDRQTLAQKRGWLRSGFQQQVERDAPSAKRIPVQYVANDGDWTDHTPEAVLTRAGLRREESEELP